MQTLTDNLAVAPFQLTRNLAGRLVFTASNGEVNEGAYPVRAYPISAPDDGLSLLGEDGHELIWIPSLTDLALDIRSLIEQELAKREFMPEIHRILDVSSFATPSTWQVETDRGETELILKAEDHIRRLGRTSLLIADSHGIYFIIRDIDQLNNHSRKLLDRFL
ncbi:MAG: DUF1854 domain-containing protein [Pseudomonadota bacterium]